MPHSDPEARREYAREYGRRKRADPEWRKKHNEYHRQHRKKAVTTKVHVRYNQYKKNTAMRFGKEFTLTMEQAEVLFKGPCHYCGDKFEELIGIDRVDNNIGYLIENCVSCCKECNFMKQHWNVDVFIAKCKKIAENWK